MKWLATGHANTCLQNELFGMTNIIFILFWPTSSSPPQVIEEIPLSLIWKNYPGLTSFRKSGSQMIEEKLIDIFHTWHFFNPEQNESEQDKENIFP